jgi:uncharacterized protein YbjT (DUF2867 family)
MIGQGLLRELLLDASVEKVLVIGRNPIPEKHEKIEEIVQKDLYDLSPLESRLSGYDACFFVLGISAAGLTEEEYRHITYDLTVSVAKTLSKLNPEMTFVYVSGQGTDSTEHGRSMWARVKGATENALLAMPFKAAYMFRPGFIRPMHGIVSRTTLYRVIYAIAWPLFPILFLLFPKHMTTTEKLGRAMIAAAAKGAPKKILEPPDIHLLA